MAAQTEEKKQAIIQLITACTSFMTAIQNYNNAVSRYVKVKGAFKQAMLATTDHKKLLQHEILPPFESIEASYYNMFDKLEKAQLEIEQCQDDIYGYEEKKDVRCNEYSECYQRVCELFKVDSVLGIKQILNINSNSISMPIIPRND